MKRVDGRKIVLKSKRVFLRILECCDITQHYIDGLNDPEVNKYLVNVSSKKQTWKTVSDYIKSNSNSKNSILLGVFDKKNNRFIGTVNISGISYFHYLCWIGICLFDKDYWGEGYALESLKRAMRFIFQDLKMHHIFAGIYNGNITSFQLFKKAGFYKQASFKNTYRHKSNFKEVVIYGKNNSRFDRRLMKKPAL